MARKTNLIFLVLLIGAAFFITSIAMPMSPLMPIDNGVWDLSGSFVGMTVAGKRSLSPVFDPDGSIFLHPAHSGYPMISVSFQGFRFVGDATADSEGYNVYQLETDVAIKTNAFSDGGTMYESYMTDITVDFTYFITAGSAWNEAYDGCITDVRVKAADSYLIKWPEKEYEDGLNAWEAEHAQSGSGTWSVSPEVYWIWPSAEGASMLTGGNTTSVNGQLQCRMRSGSIMSMYGAAPIKVTPYNVGSIITICLTVKSRGDVPTVNPFGMFLVFIQDLMVRVRSFFEYLMEFLFGILGAWLPIIFIAIVGLIALFILTKFRHKNGNR